MADVFDEDIFVTLINLPSGINEAVSRNEDGTFSVFINTRLSCEGRLRAYYHALKHIHQDDFHKEDVQSIEENVHKPPDNIKITPANKYIR